MFANNNYFEKYKLLGIGKSWIHHYFVLGGFETIFNYFASFENT